MRYTRILTCIAALALPACESSPPPGPPPLPAAPSTRQAALDVRLEQARRELDRSFVVFASLAMHIGALEAPVQPPVTVGSRPGPETMTSDAPQVVSVDANGRLVAHRDGTARIRAAGSPSSLTVVVRTGGRAGDVRRTASTR